MPAELAEVPLQSRVSQQSLVKVKFKPKANFSPVNPHRTGRAQLFSYRVTCKSPVPRKTHIMTSTEIGCMLNMYGLFENVWLMQICLLNLVTSNSMITGI